MIIRRKHNSNFTVIGNAPMNDQRLTAEALGLLCYLRSRPDDWTVLPRQLQARFSCGRDRIYRIIKELIETGYIVRRDVRGPGKTWKAPEYLVLDHPDQPFPEKPDTANTDTLLRTEKNQIPISSAAFASRTPLDPQMIADVLEALDTNGGRMMIGGLIKYGRSHDQYFDGATINNMAKAGLLDRDGKYVTLPKAKAA